MNMYASHLEGKCVLISKEEQYLNSLHLRKSLTKEVNCKQSNISKKGYIYMTLKNYLYFLNIFIDFTNRKGKG